MYYTRTEHVFSDKNALSGNEDRSKRYIQNNKGNEERGIYRTIHQQKYMKMSPNYNKPQIYTMTVIFFTPSYAKLGLTRR